MQSKFIWIACALVIVGFIMLVSGIPAAVALIIFGVAWLILPKSTPAKPPASHVSDAHQEDDQATHPNKENAAPPQAERYCTHCGAKVEQTDVFCVECGEKLN